MNSCQRQNTHWDLAPELEPVFLDAQGLKLSQWWDNGQLRIVKTGSHRTVYELTLDEGRFFLKHYRVVGLRDRLRNIVRSPKPWLEHNAAQQVAHQGIDTVTIVAKGRAVRAGMVTDSYLISRAIENAEQLDHFVARTFSTLSKRTQNLVRKNLATALGELMGRLYLGGLLHGDLHAGNLLCDAQENGTVQLWLVDLHPIAQQNEIGYREIRKNLVSMYPHFLFQSTPADRLRFLHSLWNTILAAGVRSVTTRNLYPRSIRDISRDLEGRSRKEIPLIRRKQDQKWARGNRRLIILNEADAKCRGVATLGRTFLKSVLRSPDQLLQSASAIETEQDNRPRILHALMPLFEPQERPIACRIVEDFNDTAEMSQRHRRFRFCVIQEWLWSKARPPKTRAHRAWEIGHAMLRRGIPTREPLLFVESNAGKRVRTFLVLRELPAEMSLSQCLRETNCKSGEVESRVDVSRLAIQMGKLVGQLHESGFCYPQLALENFVTTNDAGTISIAVCDVEAFRQQLNVQSHDAIKDLASLYMSVSRIHPVHRTDAIRMLRKYATIRRHQSWRPLARSIVSEIHQLEFTSPSERPGMTTISPQYDRHERAAA